MRRRTSFALLLTTLFVAATVMGVRSSTAEAGYRIGWQDCQGSFKLLDGSNFFSHVCAWGMTFDGTVLRLGDPGASYQCVHSTEQYGGTVRRFWVMSGIQARCGAWPNNGNPRWVLRSGTWVQG
jgi:hypothetical protein